MLWVPAHPCILSIHKQICWLYFQILRDSGLTHKYYRGVAIGSDKEVLILGKIAGRIGEKGCWCAVDWQKMCKKQLILMDQTFGSCK